LLIEKLYLAPCWNLDDEFFLHCNSLENDIKNIITKGYFARILCI
jgi:hypothetical protein